MVAGLLALQGDFSKHRTVFESLGAEVREVRTESDLARVDGLVVPGGESTAITKLLSAELRKALNEFAVSHAVWGTCAGMIMISREIGDSRVKPFEWMNLTVDRNGFGRQVHSFEAELRVADEIGESAKTMHGVFIRAPRVREMGTNCRPLAWLGDEIVCVRQDNLLASSFHPELTDDGRLHRYFLSMME